jgi:hypothetical protein
MAETRFRAFLSCSFASDDKDVLDFFKKMIEAFDIDVFLYDYQEIGRLSDKVKENIIRCDCLIAIATRRNKIEGSDHWACADWIQHEIALAHAYNKAIAVFIEDVVKIEGLIALEERRERFSRHDLLRQIAKITTFLFRLRNHLESTIRMRDVPLLLRHYIHAKDQLVARERVVERTEILMESLVDGLDATSHSIELEETTPWLSIKTLEFDFRCLEKPNEVKVDAVSVRNTDAKALWKVVFTPPLKRGDRVKYAFKEVRANCRPYTYEELKTRLRNGTYEYEEPKCEGCEWTIVYPTYELRHEFELPESYELENSWPEVIIGEARVKSESEIARTKQGGLFTAEKLFDKWVLKLHVPKPLLNHTYYTFYVPTKVIAQSPPRTSC